MKLCDEETPLYCTRCKHYLHELYGSRQWCCHPKSLDVVGNFRDPYSMREQSAPCGEHGMLWQSKPPAPAPELPKRAWWRRLFGVA